MTLNYMSGLCNLDHCTHPCCWNYYRKLIKHQVSPCDIEEKKQKPIEAPHQSIHNINPDLLLNKGNSNPQFEIHHRESKSNALFEYLISRKKLSSSSASQSPNNITGGQLHDSTNLSRSQPKISRLDVHEIFDMDELQSDWRKTFQAKDYYVWMPGNKDLKNSRDDLKPMRSVKTPVLQLAPVTETRANSSVHGSTRKDVLLIDDGLNSSHQKQMSLKIRTQPRSTARMEMLNDNVTSRTKEIRPGKDYVRLKSLDAAFNQAKMNIHNSSDRLSLAKYDFVNTSQVYVMDENYHENIRDLSSSRMSRQPPATPTDSESGYNRPLHRARTLKPNQVQLSIIQSVSCDNSFSLKLEPQQKRITPLKSALSHRKDCSDRWSGEEHSSVCDSLATNAISNRSTLNDDDILPGSSILHMLQNSYKLIQERSDNLTDREKNSYRNAEEHEPDREVLLHKVNVSYSRNAKSAPDKKVINVDVPHPPPPSPDISDRYRSTSAAANINFAE